jgi:MFS transporter, PPP family, 3-phenylpropionic acid transporter
MPLSAALTLSLFYLASFAVLGVYLPYFNLYLESLGFGGLQIATLTLLLPLMATLVPTLGGVLADRLRRRRELVIACSVLALLTFGLVPAARSFGAMVAVIAVYAALRSPALPLVEASAMEISAAGGPPYGRMRVWGSLAFIVTALGTGALVGARGERAALGLILALLALNALSALLLPRETVPAAAAKARSSLRRLVMQPRVLVFLLACLLSQASHGPYYVFYSIHLEKLGYPPQAIGCLWGVAVGCEIIAMLSMPRVLRRLGTLPTMGASVLVASARWWICAATADPVAMVLAQAMHAATYAAFHVAAVTHTHRLFGEEHRSSGQAVYSSAAYGLGNMLGMFLSGVLYDRTTMANLFAGASATALLSGFLVVAAARKEAASGL